MAKAVDKLAVRDSGAAAYRATATEREPSAAGDLLEALLQAREHIKVDVQRRRAKARRTARSAATPLEAAEQDGALGLAEWRLGLVERQIQLLRTTT